MVAAATALFCAFAGGAASGAGVPAPDGVRVIWSFERDETARRLPQFGYWGKPYWSRPEPGFRGVKVEPDYKGDVTAFRKASSRDYPLMTLVSRHVTHGDHAYLYRFSDSTSKTYASYRSTRLTRCTE